MKIRLYALAGLVLQAGTAFGDEVFIVGQLYNIPVDCGYEGSVKPASDGLVGYKGMVGNLEAQPEFNRMRWDYIGKYSGTVDVTMEGELILSDTAVTRVRQFNGGNLNVNMEYHGTPDRSFYYLMGCADEKFKTVEWKFSGPPTGGDFSMKVSRTITVPARPPGAGADYGFYAQAEFTVLAVIGAALPPDRSAKLSVTCRDGSTVATADHILHLPGAGTHFLTIPTGDFNFENCSNTQFELDIELNGSNFQLDGLEALYYQHF